MTLLRSESGRRNAGRKSALQTLMDRVNALLLERNDASLFATVFCALLDTTTGRLSYVNAGHCPPLVSPPGKPFRALAEPRNPVIGIVDGFSYVGGELMLEPGTSVVLYTDGVTEASSATQGDFGSARLTAAIDGAERRAAALLEATLSAVAEFAGAEPQSDDIAVLVARYLGRP
jgi:sigma-B regulation protein RsbU (phosphoserine phosphatase)